MYHHSRAPRQKACKWNELGRKIKSLEDRLSESGRNRNLKIVGEKRIPGREREGGKEVTIAFW